ncbi:hypothetical protein [Lentibacter algarum]|uniref:hypothetical protein n=1 Tax=Lentibacter algarum TaxID=576131 RepID=UPI002090CF20|nr:hypothetical protein [Lentibacter algarum]
MFAAQSACDQVTFFAKQGASFRPNLFEKLGEDGLVCSALAPLQLFKTTENELFDLAKLVCLSSRADKKLALTASGLRQPAAQNPAFLIQYAALRCRQAKPAKLVGGLDESSISMLCKLATFPDVIARAHELGEPQRIGLFLRDCADSLLMSAPNDKIRGQKGVSEHVLAVADIVFSVGLSILGTQPLDEIS